MITQAEFLYYLYFALGSGIFIGLIYSLLFFFHDA